MSCIVLLLKKLSLLELCFCEIFQIPSFQSSCMVNFLLQVKLKKKVSVSFQPKSDSREIRLCFLVIIIIIINFTPPTLLTPQK